MKLFKFLIIIGWFFTSSLQSEAQQILFGNYTVGEGLPSTMVLAINQDDQGYMWFGTRNGLSRFDGYQFKTFQFNKNDTTSIGNNFIQCISKIDSTHLWIGTENGIYILDLQKEVFTKFKGTLDQAVFDILKDKDGVVWITTKLDGLYRYNPKDKSIVHFTKNASNNSLSSNLLTRIIQDSDGKLWIGTLGAGIEIYDPVATSFSNIRSGAHGLSSDIVITLYKGVDGTVWIGTMNGGLGKWQADKDCFKIYKTGNSSSISDNIVRCMYQKSPDKLYIGTEKGLNILDTRSDSFIAYTNKVNDPFGISDNAVYSIFPGKAGTMWVGTWFGGVSYFSIAGSFFELYYPDDKPQSLHGRAVSCFLEDKPHYFWVGTEDGGLYYFNAEDKSFLKYPFKQGQQDLSYHNVHCLYKDSHGNIWIGIFAGGVNVLNPLTGKINRYNYNSDNINTLNSNQIFSIYEDREHVIWVGTDKGLNRYDPVTNSFIRVEQPTVNNTLVYDMYEDNNRTLWVATYNNYSKGLVSYNKKRDEWSLLPAGTGKNMLSSNKLVCLLDDHAGNLWIGTDGGGLNRYNFKTKQVTIFDDKAGIAANSIYGIQQDDNGILWLTSNNGIYAFNPESGKVKHFTRQDNLQSQQFNYKSFYKARDGKLFAGGIKGFNSFYPEKIADINSHANISFTNFQLFNKNVSLGDKKNPLTEQINYTKKLILNYDQSVFSLEFAALNSSNPEKVRYAYKMEGFDANWNFVGEQRKATYTNLSPGHYTFKVKASTDESNWDVPETSMLIVIKPPFYKTTLAYIIYLLLLVAAGISIYKYSSNHIRKQNAIRLERLKNKEEKEFYARKIEFFTVMAHEIRTPLSLIMAPLEKLLTLKKWEKEESEQLKIMEDNSERLMGLVNQLLDFRRIESDAYHIKKEEVEIVSLVQSIYSRFSSITYQKNIEFAFTTKVSNQKMLADPEVLNKIISNLLINAFKFARKKVKIKLNDFVNTATGSKSLLISVEDDGIGIPAGDIRNVFKKFFTTTSGGHQYHNLGSTGIGLALASSLAEKHGGSLLVESLEGTKTIFTLELPLNDEKAIAKSEDSIKVNEGNEIDNENKPLIHLIEDDQGIMSFIANSLISEGYRVQQSRNGKEALLVMENSQPDIIISDIMMPVMDGIELCRAIKTNIHFSHVPFVLVTAKGNSDSEIEGIETGADAYILKPFKWKYLLAIIKNLLDARERLKLKYSEQPASEISVLTTNSRDKEFMEKIVGIIDSRIIDAQLSVEELSREMCMSRSSLHKKLKSLSGYVPNELIKLVRLKQAARLLQANGHTIAEIAYLTGFSSPSYFSKCFLQQFKISPKEYSGKQQASGDLNEIDAFINKANE